MEIRREVMFNLMIKEEDVVMKITARKPVSNIDIANNVIGNVITRAGGNIADKVNLILTNDILYLEYKGNTSVGYAEETRKIEELHLKTIKSFEVTPIEKEELINIITSKNSYTFIRNNTKNENLAFAMSRVINDIK